MRTRTAGESSSTFMPASEAPELEHSMPDTQGSHTIPLLLAVEVSTRKKFAPHAHDVAPLEVDDTARGSSDEQAEHATVERLLENRPSPQAMHLLPESPRPGGHLHSPSAGSSTKLLATSHSQSEASAEPEEFVVRRLAQAVHEPSDVAAL
jgi:hypothetical protein